MQDVKVITARGDSSVFQSDINRAIANGWQLGQLSTCSNGGVVFYTMIMTKDSNVVGAGSPNIGVPRESLQMAVKVSNPIDDAGRSISQYDMR